MPLANNDFPLYNENACSWADMTLKLSGDGLEALDIKDISAVNTGVSMEFGVQKAGGRPMRRTTGEVSYEASLTMYRSGYLNLLRTIKNASSAETRGDIKLLSLVTFDLIFLHSVPGDDNIYKVEIKGCRLAGRTLNGAEGTDADQVEVPLNPMEIIDTVDGERVAFL